MSTNGSPNPTPESVVRDFLGALERLDIEAACALVSDDILYENKGLPAVRGRAQFDRAMASLARYMDGFEARTHNLAVDGDVVLTERTDVFHKAEFRAEFWVCGRFEVRDGQIVVWRDYFDFVNVTLACVKGLVGLALERRRRAVTA